MHFILDTHFLIWSLYDPKTLPRDVRDIIENESSYIEYSIISLWETEIKHQKHPDSFTFNCEEVFRDARAEGYRLMDLEPAHIAALSSLDEPTRRHKDPFDRMLIAQAKYENVYLLTHDKRLAGFGEECVQYL